MKQRNNGYVPALNLSVPPTMDPITDVVVNEGANPTLQCKAAGSPIPMVQWFKGNNLYRDQTVNCKNVKYSYLDLTGHDLLTKSNTNSHFLNPNHTCRD